MNIESPAIGVRRLRLSRILSILGWVGMFAALPGAVLLMDQFKTINPGFIFATYLFWLGPWVSIGFSSQGHLTQHMRRTLGVTPGYLAKTRGKSGRG